MTEKKTIDEYTDLYEVFLLLVTKLKDKREVWTELSSASPLPVLCTIALADSAEGSISDGFLNRGEFNRRLSYSMEKS